MYLSLSDWTGRKAVSRPDAAPPFRVAPTIVALGIVSLLTSPEPAAESRGPPPGALPAAAPPGGAEESHPAVRVAAPPPGNALLAPV